MGGRFAGEVAGIELGDGGVDVVEVETTIAAIRSSASISTTASISTRNASGRWSRPENRVTT